MAEFTVPDEMDGISVRSFLRRQCGVSARLLAKLKRTENGMTVNGRIVRSIDILRGGDTVCLVFPQDSPEIVPVMMGLDIVYEDDSILITDKPPFMPVHPVHVHQLDTLANGVMYYLQSRGEGCTFRAVNRLDRDTSGLVMIAKNSFAHTFLSHNTEKKYMALCEGIISSEGTIDAPIELAPGHTIQRRVGENGVRAVTHYRPLETLSGHTLLELSLETGRTHQIRTHLSYLGHPLAGDDMYGGSVEIFRRQCLHCSEMSFIHPLTRERIILKSPPEDWLSVLREKCGGNKQCAAEDGGTE